MADFAISAADFSATQLTELTTDEVSLVKRGANLKRVALAKQGDEMEEMLNAALATEHVCEKELPELPEGIDAALRVAVRAMKAHGEELPVEARTFIAKMIGAELVQPAEPTPEEIEKSLPEAIQKELVEARKARKEAEEKQAAAEKALELEKIEKHRMEIAEVAKSLPMIPGDDAKKTDLILKAEAAGLKDELLEIFSATNAQLTECELFKSAGVRQQEAPSARKELEGLVKKEMEANPALSSAQAEVKILAANKELKRRVREEDRSK